MNTLPLTVSSTLYIVLGPSGDVSLCSSAMSGITGWTVLGTTEVTVDVPQENPLLKVIEGLESNAEDILAVAQAKVREIHDQIQNLKCLEHDGEAK